MYQSVLCYTESPDSLLTMYIICSIKLHTKKYYDIIIVFGNRT